MARVLVASWARQTRRPFIFPPGIWTCPPGPMPTLASGHVVVKHLICLTTRSGDKIRVLANKASGGARCAVSAGAGKVPARPVAHRNLAGLDPQVLRDQAQHSCGGLELLGGDVAEGGREPRLALLDSAPAPVCEPHQHPSPVGGVGEPLG